MKNDLLSLPHTREEARMNGSKYYFTGMACNHGHISERYTSSGRCGDCARITAKSHRDADPGAANARAQQWRANKKKHLREYGKKVRGENPERFKDLWRQWYEKNKDEHNRRRREKRAADPEPHKARARKWKEENPEKYKESYTKSFQKERSTPKGKLEHSISSGIRRGILKGAKSGRKTFEILGYSVEQLMHCLEKQFQPGMTWDNYGKDGWEIDHETPLSAHNYETPDDIDFKKAWSLENLRPMWASENRSKGAKVSGGFQPSLALAVPANDNKQQEAQAA